MNYVYSTLSAGNTYCAYGDSPNGMSNVLREIKINGLVNVAVPGDYDKGHNNNTSRGACTPVSDDDLAILEKDHTFQTHLSNGFIKIEKGKRMSLKQEDIEKYAAENLTPEDNSAPVTPKNQKDKIKEALRLEGKDVK